MYPLALLPKSIYTPLIDNKCLKGQAEVVLLLRRVDKPLSQVYNHQTKTIKEGLFQSSDLPDMSLSLPCLHFEVTCSGFKQKGNGIADWPGLKDVNMHDHQHDWDPVGYPFTNIFFPFADLDGHIFPVDFSAYNDKLLAEKKLTHLAKLTAENGKLEIWGKGLLQVAHKPTNLNYWHFVINLFIEGDLIHRSAISGPVKKAIKTFFEDHMKAIGQIEHTDFSHFDPKNCYLKTG